ncbi:3-deoxy-D-manno-octulosonic acid kinase [Psychrosphaera saromensis]|uniref:3-deoxy-D-manno-octulosonic acid kinase n=1 Tax=Psychrosphaera saromensis TaxID=716813 RepID=A0A2S7URZ8_9GAMM|nr:3-deoxy-D-manno-octulosonic acid kinase [Psychrosphaera saromensis]PQJ52723.1 3-deoxy-D-manno-octulosonic acid kinase [Psychrosphaera saromensis]GHB70718.1 3-deoxy-D-manno-octulosonic acid kinase [Psychrosphaera saromensis]GLQ13208.1 3-deoxy-D-manno-octulosonic acid kinase [Psychrosphaera saromensis]
MLSDSTAILWRQTIEKNQTIFAHPSLEDTVTSDWFNADYWSGKRAITGESKGRNTTYFIKYNADSGSSSPERHFVLRHYYRGGLVSKILHDEFLYTELNKTRSIAELTMLQKMVDLGLPVPNPIAAMVTKVAGLWCRNDILIEKIADAKDGFHWLLAEDLSDDVWQNIGATIKRFHQARVCHSDLNIHNIMIDNSGKVFLIDFDRCEFREPEFNAPAIFWQQANLNRLLRSLRKEKDKAENPTINKKFHFSDAKWQQLLLGYAK